MDSGRRNSLVMVDIVTRRQAAHLEEIYTTLRTKDITLSKTVAAKIVGGRYTLEKLITGKRIRMTQLRKGHCARWYCNAADVLKHVNFKEQSNYL